MIKTCWCFKISEKAGLAFDDNGNPGAAYMQCGLEHELSISDGEYKKIHFSFVKGIAAQFGLEEDWITPITEEEYN